MGDCHRTYHTVIALTLAFVLVTRGASAQAAGRLSGVVTNAISGGPVADALITARGSSDSARSDAQGWYALEGVLPGLVKVTAQVIGYVPITTPYYSVRPDSTTHVDFKLAPLSVQLDTLQVLGRRQGRRWDHGSQIITRERLPTRGDILDGLKGVVAGLQITGRDDAIAVKVRGSNASVLFVVNGVVVKPPLTFYIDAAEVDCVEVRRGYRAAQEFRPGFGGQIYSGVILIWTRGSNARRPRGCVRS